MSIRALVEWAVARLVLIPLQSFLRFVDGSKPAVIDTLHQRFFGAGKDDEFCEGCHNFNVDDFTCRPGSTYPNIKPPPTRIGKFYEILKNKRCPLCKLLSPMLDAHIDAHRKVKTPLPENLVSAFVWLEAVSMPALRLYLRWDLENCNLPFPDTFAIVQVSKPVNKRVVDTELVKSWLLFCEREHKICNSVISNITSDNSAEYLFIDVEQCIRIQPRQLPRFVALSYVVGGISHKITEDISRPFKLQNLPKTLRDAILFTHTLGERYLWIDSLCISREPAKRKEQIARMNEIYSRAVCVLVAAWGRNANAGLPASHDGSPRNISAQLQKVERLKQGMPIVYSIVSLDYDDIYLSHMHLVRKHKWITRAWTAQESLLAQKVVVFNGRDVFFICHESRGFEKKVDLRTWVYPTFEFCLDRKKVALENADHFKWGIYEKVVREVADKQITYEDDRLNAMMGLLQHLKGEMCTEFEMGLPLSQMDYALMWECKKIHSVKNYPSWTWLGKVPSFPIDKRVKRKERLNVDPEIEVDKSDNSLLWIKALAVQTPPNEMWKCQLFQSDGGTSWDVLGPKPWANIHPDGHTWTQSGKTIRMGSLHCLLIVGDIRPMFNDVAFNSQSIPFFVLLVIEETGDGRFRRIGIAEMPREEFDALKPRRREFILK